MTNTALHVILPKGLKLKNGMMLYKDATFTFVSRITPWYASVEQVQLAGGPYVKKLPDLTIGAIIYESSKDADTHTYVTPPAPQSQDPNDPAFRRYKLFANARQNWVVATAAHDLLSTVWDSLGARGNKTLANLSVERMAAVTNQGIPERVDELAKEADKWRIVLNSGGDVGFGGHVKGTWGSKALYDPDAPAGRTWVVTGLGANAKSSPGYGSAGKPVKYASGPLLAWRLGRYYGSQAVQYHPYAPNVAF